MGSEPGPATVVVVGEDAIVGQALELLLRSADYGVRFVNLASFGVRRSLDGACLLMLGPGLSGEDRKAVLSSVLSNPKTGKLPVLELVPAAPYSRLARRHFLAPWPCRPEVLQGHVEEALRSGCDGVPLRQGPSRAWQEGADGA